MPLCKWILIKSIADLFNKPPISSPNVHHLLIHHHLTSPPLKWKQTYGGVSIVGQVVVRDTLDPPGVVLDCVGEHAHPDLVIAAEWESTPSGVLGGGRGAGKVDVNRGLSDAIANLKKYIQGSVSLCIQRGIITHGKMFLPRLLAAAGVSVAPVELLLGGGGRGREQHTVDYRGG